MNIESVRENLRKNTKRARKSASISINEGIKGIGAGVNVGRIERA